MTDEEIEKASFIDGEMQKRFYINGEKFTIEDVEYVYDVAFEEGRISTIEKYSQVDRATIISEETLEEENKKLKERIVELEEQNTSLTDMVDWEWE